MFPQQGGSKWVTDCALLRKKNPNIILKTSVKLNLCPANGEKMSFEVNGHTCGHSIHLYESTEDIVVNPASALTVWDKVLYMSCQARYSVCRQVMFSPFFS